MPLIYRASQPEQLLEIFEQEREGWGWMTVKETVVRFVPSPHTAAVASAEGRRVGRRMAKLVAQAERQRRPAPLDRADPRLRALLAVSERALHQGGCSSTARLGRHSDDLTKLAAALSQLGLEGSELGLALEAKLEEEADEEGPRGEGEVEDPLGWQAR